MSSSRPFDYKGYRHRVHAVFFNADLMGIVFKFLGGRDMFACRHVCSVWHRVYTSYEWISVVKLDAVFDGARRDIASVKSFKFYDGGYIEFNGDDGLVSGGSLSSNRTGCNLGLLPDVYCGMWEFQINCIDSVFDNNHEFVAINILMSIGRLRDYVKRGKEVPSQDFLLELTSYLHEHDDNNHLELTQENISTLSTIDWIKSIEDNPVIAKYTSSVKWKGLYFDYFSKNISLSLRNYIELKTKGGVIIDKNPYKNIIKFIKDSTANVIDVLDNCKIYTPATLIICKSKEYKDWSGRDEISLCKLSQGSVHTNASADEITKCDVVLITDAFLKNPKYFFAHFPVVLNRKPVINDIARRQPKIQQTFEENSNHLNTLKKIALEWFHWNRIIISGNNILNDNLIFQIISQLESNHKWFIATEEPESLYKLN
eukprot:TRINITY_DN9206_c0_g1_i1.p1 TRINITY_DN9206_c0_g1~~TRINITY_DN9206_c0_g1_i1.p1  ORF type:complete len:428 (+),score=67.36 TRINITY_DN9206_c0_g1_i1:1-1284(+)